MPDFRKPLEQLLAERNAHRGMQHRNFTSKGDNQMYQVLLLVHTEDRNDLQVCYSLCAFPQLQFSMPIDKFLERFEPSQALANVG